MGDSHVLAVCVPGLCRLSLALHGRVIHLISRQLIRAGRGLGISRHPADCLA